MLGFMVEKSAPLGINARVMVSSSFVRPTITCVHFDTRLKRAAWCSRCVVAFSRQKRRGNAGSPVVSQLSRLAHLHASNPAHQHATNNFKAR